MAGITEKTALTIPIITKDTLQPTPIASTIHKEASPLPTYIVTITSPKASPLFYDGKYKAKRRKVIGSKQAVKSPKRARGHKRPQKLVAKAIKAVLAEKPKQIRIRKNFSLGK